MREEEGVGGEEHTGPEIGLDMVQEERHMYLVFLFKFKSIKASLTQRRGKVFWLFANSNVILVFA